MTFKLLPTADELNIYDLEGNQGGEVAQSSRSLSCCNTFQTLLQSLRRRPVSRVNRVRSS